ncbi:MAG: HAD family phosphatase [Clostridia bacterium]|nr:HAD family phosphatase [Clostridia bacterium]
MRSFIFDFNGTLFRDTEFHRLAWTQFMAMHGIAISDDDFRQKMNGPGNDVILRNFFGEGPSDGEIATLSEEKERIYRAIVLADPARRALAPGAVETLDMLKARRVPCCVATASIRANVDFYMEDLGLKRWFDYRHIFYMTGELPGKPDPAIYRAAMERLGFQPEDTLVVEDSLPGIQSAAGAGVGGIIAIGETVPPEVLAHMPRVIAHIQDFYGFERFLENRLN